MVDGAVKNGASRAPSPDDVALVRGALDGHRPSIALLVDRLMPVVRARVRRALARRQGALGPADGDDLVQELWLLLMEDRGRRLRAYDPTRGATLEGFVGLLADRELARLFERAQAKKRGGHLRAVAGHDPEALVCPAPRPDELAEGRQAADVIRQRVRTELGARGDQVFVETVYEGRGPPEAAARLGVAVQVVYNWQHRIRALLRGPARADAGPKGRDP